jgi:outer membrane lipoprotein carrier protein
MKLFRQVIYVTVLLGSLAIFPVHAGVALERLQGFFKEVHSLQGDFTQTTFDQHNHISQRSQGTFAIQRPGKFHWDYTAPYQQLIVANNKKVWLYDSELEQVTVKRLDEAAVDDLEWVELTPHEKNTSFEHIRLGFDQHNLRTMELIDNFGHTTRLEFSHVQRNPQLATSLFEFTPPPGVDVIGE